MNLHSQKQTLANRKSTDALRMRVGWAGGKRYIGQLACCISVLFLAVAAYGRDPFMARRLAVWDGVKVGTVGPLDGLPQQDSIVAYYPLDGTAYDEISQTTGSWGAAVETNNAVRGTAAYVTGGHVQTVNSSLLNGKIYGTISAWVNLYSSKFASGIVLSGDNLGINERDTYFEARGLGTGSFGGKTTGNWFHLLITIEALGTSKGKMYLYKNGQFVGSPSAVNASSITQSLPFLIGYWNNQPTRRMGGVVDEVIIWDKLLTSNEVWQVYSRDKDAAGH